MPRQARLDAPGALHHVIGRGIEGISIFRSDEDRENWLSIHGRWENRDGDHFKKYECKNAYQITPADGLQPPLTLVVILIEIKIMQT